MQVGCGPHGNEFLLLSFRVISHPLALDAMTLTMNGIIYFSSGSSRLAPQYCFPGKCFPCGHQLWNLVCPPHL